MVPPCLQSRQHRACFHSLLARMGSPFMAGEPKRLRLPHGMSSGDRAMTTRCSERKSTICFGIGFMPTAFASGGTGPSAVARAALLHSRAPESQPNNTTILSTGGLLWRFCRPIDHNVPEVMLRQQAFEVGSHRRPYVVSLDTAWGP